MHSYKEAIYHHAPLMSWSLQKYKCLWGVGGKAGFKFLEEIFTHIYI